MSGVGFLTNLIFPGHCDKLADRREVTDVTYLELPLGCCSPLRDIPPPAPENGGSLSRSLSPKLRGPGPLRASHAQGSEGPLRALAPPMVSPRTGTSSGFAEDPSVGGLGSGWGGAKALSESTLAAGNSRRGERQR